jgi:hypothetical protein
MKNVMLLLFAIVLTVGLLFGASSVNASYEVQTAEKSGGCCPSVETIQTKTVDSGCCPGGDAAPITAEKDSGCQGHKTATTAKQTI